MRGTKKRSSQPSLEVLDNERLTQRLFAHSDRYTRLTQSSPLVPKASGSATVSSSQFTHGLMPKPILGKSSSTVSLGRKLPVSSVPKSSQRGPKAFIQPVQMARDTLSKSSSVPVFEPVTGGAPMAKTTSLASFAERAMAASFKRPRKPSVQPPVLPSEACVDDSDRPVFKTFTETLNLDSKYMDEFLAGNFLYLAPKRGVERSAYDLEIVEHWETDPSNYYTMSRSGITHFVGTDSEFTTLQQWEREFYLYNLISRIPFFRKYRQWKNFIIWKKAIKQQKIKSCSSQLLSDCFYLNDSLRQSLLRLKALCCEVSGWVLYAYDREKTYTLDEFLEEQAIKRYHITSWLQDFATDIRLLVRSGCDRVLDTFLTENKIMAEHKMSFMERAAMRTECRKLTRFIRLSDFIVRDTLFMLALNSTRQLMDFLKPVEGAKITVRITEEDDLVVRTHKELMESPMFVTNASFTADGKMKLSPDIKEFKDRLKSVVSDGVSVICSVDGLLGHDELASYVKAALDDPSQAEDGSEDERSEAIMENTLFKAATRGINVALKEMVEKALEYCRLFEPFFDIYSDNEQQSQGLVEQYKDADLSLFTQSIAKFKGQHSQFEGIPRTADVGALRVDSSRLKARLLPSPTKCLLALRELLPQLINTSCKELLDTLNSLHSVMSMTPSSVEQFVVKMRALGDVQEQLPVIRERHSRVTTMGEMVQENMWTLGEEVKIHMLMVQETLTQLEHSVQLFETKLEEDVQTFSAELDKQIPVLKSAVVKIREQLDSPSISDPGSHEDDVLLYLSQLEDDLAKQKKNATDIQEWQAELKKEVSEFEALDEVHADLQLKHSLWDGIRSWNLMTNAWKAAPFHDIDAGTVDKQVKVFEKTCLRCARGLPGNPAVPTFRQAVDSFKLLLPVVLSLRNPALKPRHWDEIEEVIGQDFAAGKEYTLGELLDLNVEGRQEEIALIAERAASEAALEMMFSAKVLTVWKDLEFIVLPFKDSKEVFILGSVEDIVANLDDSLVAINTILGSRHCKPIRDDVEKWQKNLMTLSETLDEWLLCQKQWMYLETIFSAADIQRQLPEESKLFFNVDKLWKDIMTNTNQNPKAVAAGAKKGLKETFIKCNATLDKIQKRLEDYLETKRVAFPRFYFLSNDELLEILAQTRNVQAVQPHLRKCFDAINRLDFGRDPRSIDIYAMLSPEQERIALGRNLKARGNVETWLMGVQMSMMSALGKLMKAGVQDYAVKDRSQWVRDHAGQVVATVAQIMWSVLTEEALRKEDAPTAMEDWYQLNLRQLADLTALVRSDLSKLERKVIVALVTTDVHARDIVERLKLEKVDSVNNFTWQMQLRYYWDAAIDAVVVYQSNCRIEYGLEYQGCTSRLVITPLTDRCWMTITGALHIKLGANPAGPAGTGKTESSKDLAKAMAIQCIVFNCSDQIDYKMLGKLFSGLSQCGCWTCLDEFNRIDIEVLSVVAQQLLVLRQGILQGLDHMEFEGRTIRLRPHCVIVTMNPGYAGRTELPDNLKVLFRPVAMMVPDYALIAEIILFAVGFDDAKNLSRRVTKLYKLSSEQLSQQRHYDYGLRAVKSVLVMAGALKRNNPDLSEDVVLIRAMRDSNVPKFLAEDLPLFAAIVMDLFPGVVVPLNDYGELQVSLEEQIVLKKMVKVPKFIEKVIQLYETFNVRFGVVLVGPTGSGKSTCRDILAASMTSLRENGSTEEKFQKVRMNILNPKCISMGELYGEFNELTQEWKDGLASTMLRLDAAEDSIDRRWTVFDGPIDALWIENMNTVLDDNQTLCLANGERIKLKGEMRMLFEVEDLEVASPATVSRLGVVYLSPQNLGWKPFVRQWLDAFMPPKVPKATLDFLWVLFGKTLDAGLKFQREKCTEPVVTVDLQQAESLCHLLTSLLLEADYKYGDIEPAELHAEILSLFAFSYVWTLGGSISDADYEKFSDFVTSLDMFCEIRWNANSVFEVFCDMKNHCQFVKWDEIVPAFQYDPGTSFFRMVVPTVDTVRFAYLTERLVATLSPMFLTGVTGTGKTVIVQDLLTRLSNDDDVGADTRRVNALPVFVNFSAQTHSQTTQESFEGKLVKKRKNLLGAPANKTVVVSVDDVNMPAVEEYGAQPPIELLRQFLDYKGFYDREKLFWKNIVETVLIVIAAPPGGGRNPVTKRFSRHFHVLCVPPAAEMFLARIFGSILGGFLEKFAPTVAALKEPVVRSTIGLYKRICEVMRPTPAKSHYTFNLRDVSKVIQGCLMCSHKTVKDADVFTKLWVHESMRVFHDRLVSVEDKGWVQDYCCELLAKNFLLPTDEWKRPALFENPKSPLIFTDFLRPRLGDDDPGVYEYAPDFSKVTKLLDNALDDYNLDHPTQMRLVFFRDAVEHVTRICRILRQPRGNAMLVGVGGSGKQSLTRMACAIEDIQVSSIELTRGYGLFEFREDLKAMMRIAGMEGKPIAFLFTDTQIVDERFLEDINNVLNTGEVSNLWEADELNAAIEAVTPVVQEMGLPEIRDVIYQTFIERIRDNLHIVLAMSPVGDSLRVRCRQFPSLINCCTIDWYMPWPEDALISVANRFLSEEDLTDEVRGALVKGCTMIHKTVSEEFAPRIFQELQRKIYTTPKSYLDLIDLYLSMLTEKREELSKRATRLQSGVTKLEDTNEMVIGLKNDLNKLMPVLAVKSKETEALLKQVAKDQIEADKMKAKVEIEAGQVTKQAEAAAELQADAKRDLDRAMPAYEAAVKALDSLSKSDITEIKSFTKPPPAVQVVMEAVCILLGQKADWDTSKRLLGGMNFMTELKEYDKDNIPPARIKKIKKYVENPVMEVEAVQRVSIAATSLCMWVHAMDVYDSVAKEVQPKKDMLEQLNAELAKANATLQAKQAELQKVLDQVAELQQKCDATVAEKNRLMEETELTKNRLERAEKLTSGLKDEKERWKQTVAIFNEQIHNLVGDVFLASACVSYFGAFTGLYRVEMVDYWLKKCHEWHLPTSQNAALVTTIGDPVQIRDWQINGLPTDAVSTDNAILVTRGKRWPLCIDPQEQAKKWIKRTYGSKLDITRLTSPVMLRTLENCIRVGRPLLIEDVGEVLDPALEPVLAKAIFKSQGRTLLHLGDSDVDYDPNFKFFLSTKMANPHYLPEVCIKVTVINFTVTKEGLEDQLLGLVVKKERPDVEENKNRLVVSMAADKRQLKDIEDKILLLLSESKGNILDDIELIKTLQDSKVISGVISERLQESEKTELVINEMRSKYNPVAIRGTIIYFVIADLARVDPMYQYSLSYFNRLYNMCIDESAKSDVLDERLKNLISFMTENIYANICRGLFESHKLMFSFLICVQVLLENGNLLKGEWSLLLRGAGLLINPLPNPSVDTIGEPSWNFLYALETNLPQFFEGLSAAVIDDIDDWKAWQEKDAPNKEPLPSGFEEKLTLFQKMLVLKGLREDTVLVTIKDFVQEKMGAFFVRSPPVKLADVYVDTDKTTPVIFVLSVGADPTGMLLNFAKSRKYADRLRVISLGQGQGQRAQNMIMEASKTGDWVVLQNCHLAKSWMPTLEKLCDQLQDITGDSALAHCDENFRLFLTSMPADYFPVPVLQNGVKLTTEPPKGLRANLTRSLQNMDGWTEWEGCAKPDAWKKLAFGLCFFHATIQERRKFGPLGWNICYEFNDSDLEVSLQMLRMFLDEQPRIPWDALEYVTGHINYGGRVTDDWDRRCLISIIRRFFTTEILGEKYEFSPSGIYYTPTPAPLDEFRRYVDQLPLNDAPEIFGMHENANISFLLQETDALIKTCLGIQPRETATGDAKSPDEVVSDLAGEILSRLPGVLKLKEAGPNTFVMKGTVMDSLATVLKHEMVRYNKLLAEMSKSLDELRRAIVGEVLMSDVLDLMYTSLMNNMVPLNWERVAYPSLKPLASWVKDLHSRIEFIHEWLINAQPRVFWLSGFFFPQGFMTGALQNHARKHAIPIDTLNFSFEVWEVEEREDVTAEMTPTDGVLVAGLYMDGARWDREAKEISDSKPGEMYGTVPIIHFIPTPHYECPPHLYSCPVYKTSTRAGELSTTGISTNFVVAVDLPTGKKPDYWVLKGAAFLCQLND